MTSRYFKISSLLIVILTISLFIISCKPNQNTKQEKQKVTDTIVDDLTKLTNEVAANPGKVDPLIARAKYYAHNNKFNEALADVNAALDLDKENAVVYMALSEVYLYSGKTQRALDALKKAKELAPDNSDVDVSIARIYLTMSDYKQTFTALREALKKNPNNAEAFFISGLANEEMGDTIKAIDNYQATASKNPKHYDALKQLGILFSLRHNPLAIDYLRNAASLKPKSPDPLYILGMHYQENGAPDKALSVYQEIIQVDSTFKLAHYNTGYIYLVYKGDYQSAIDAFSRALKIDPEYADALYNRGYAKELSGLTEEARTDYQAVLRMKINDDKAIQGLNRLDALSDK
ncbi:MAG TPA: tetratricopeptide repeat protein [Lentimicrobium sp.]|nr:tetratricopeptide repeat protein [Lentimicrobium sp.]